MMSSLQSTTAAAKYLGVSKKTLLKWCKEARIIHIRYPGGTIKFRQETLDFFLAKHTIPATNAPPRSTPRTAAKNRQQSRADIVKP